MSSFERMVSTLRMGDLTTMQRRLVTATAILEALEMAFADAQDLAIAATLALAVERQRLALIHLMTRGRELTWARGTLQ